MTWPKVLVLSGALAVCAYAYARSAAELSELRAFLVDRKAGEPRVSWVRPA